MNSEHQTAKRFATFGREDHVLVNGLRLGRMIQMTDDLQSVAVLVDDMFFSVKINAAVSACGRTATRVKSQEQLEGLVKNPPSLIIVDLNSDRLDPLEAIRFLKASAELARIPVVSFVSHVQTDLIRGAQSAGCDYVLPRSAFTQFLTEIVAGNFAKLA